MKKIYIKPEIETIEAEANEIMAGSYTPPEEERQISGEPSTDGTNVGVLDGSEFDPWNGHGQGDGNGNRAKGGFGNIWIDDINEF